MLNRIIQIPLLLLAFIILISVIIPIFYWLFTGEDPADKFCDVVEQILDIEIW